MVTRVGLAVAVVAILMAGCAKDPKRRTPPIQSGPACKILTEVQCKENSQCVWNADKGKCKDNQSEGEGSEQDDPNLDKQLKNPNR
jgi:hypothetical protein